MNSTFKPFLFSLCVSITLLISLPCLAGELDEMAARARNCGVSEAAVSQAESLSASTSPDAAASVLSPLLNCCVDQLPITPLETKLAEGVAKRVPPAVIARALQKQLDSYRFARELLLTTAGTSDGVALEIVGNGVAEGVARSSFSDFVATYRDRPGPLFEAGLTMVSLQGQAGFDYALTRRILDRGFASGSLTTEWKYFVRVILEARKHSIEDQAVTDAAVAVLDEGGPVSDVLPALGFTGRNLGGAGLEK
ncbi:hypothetical protein [Pseudodesulfovibrio sp. zrk46]|uniref:hypothetical protein n=1 Tax=Pseudodesulfovibrio sp. zrk46 TaxID=2725288 RepID=UPI00144945F6|nr:hypothetical protein [Pseudodesulfovibrio sp. zrk46]QJB57006.1 hypothetical protein HFN16_11600 [Pseudodesulfovibrio sp. zrk46]